MRGLGVPGGGGRGPQDPKITISAVGGYLTSNGFKEYSHTIIASKLVQACTALVYLGKYIYANGFMVPNALKKCF